MSRPDSVVAVSGIRASLRRLRHVVRKEFLQLRQDRKMIPMLVVAPILQLVVLGLAANLDVTQVPFVLVDRDRTEESRDLVAAFTSSGYFQLHGAEDRIDQVDRWLLTGKAQLALVVGAGYGDAVASGRSPSIQILADGTDANSALVGLSYASSIVSGESQRLARRAFRSPVTPGRVEIEPRIWYNPDLRSRWFYVPAILALVLMLTTMILPSMAVVREKEIGTLEQLMVTPVRSWELMLGKLLPFGMLGMVTLVLVTILTVTLFRVPLRGSFLLLLALSALFLLTTLGLGLLVSTIVKNQQQAMMGSVFVLMVPMIYLSGLLFPIENMPKVMQIGTYGIPLRYYNDILRGIFLRGAGLREMWQDAAALLGYGVLIVAVASRRFRKRLD